MIQEQEASLTAADVLKLVDEATTDKATSKSDGVVAVRGTIDPTPVGPFAGHRMIYVATAKRQPGQSADEAIATAHRHGQKTTI